MAVGDLQFNPSTGLASFNAATSKAQLIYDPNICTNCGGLDTPSSIQVTLNGILECPDCFLGGIGLSHKFTIIGTLNTTWVLTQSGSCRWEVTSPGNVIRHRRHNNTFCGGSFTDIDRPITIRVDRNLSFGELFVLAGPITVFGNASWVIDSKCIEATSVANVLNCVEFTVPFKEGTAAIIEL